MIAQCDTIEYLVFYEYYFEDIYSHLPLET